MTNISINKAMGSHSSLKVPSLKDKRIAIVSTYVPRKCGIGAYTKDLASNLNLLNPARPVEIIAMDGEDENHTLVYPSEVNKVIRQNQWQDYVNAAAHINGSIIDLVIVQHEFGIFGGPNGAMVVDFVKLIKKPIIITFHTILQNPNDTQRKIINKLSKKAQKIFVMLPSVVDTLVKIYQVSRSKVEVIPLGTPNFSFVMDNLELKVKFGLKNKTVMSSINFVSKGKGFEHVIQALPEISKKFPNFIYLIIGQTHPVALKREGEIYRTHLEEQVNALGLQNNVKFINKYVSAEEAYEYIQLSDFYITPYDGLEQISSASLSYAIAAGKICISTAFRYASENLSGGRGYLVGEKNPQEIMEAVLHGLTNPIQTATMRKKCFSAGRLMVWPKVAYQHLEVFDNVLYRQSKKEIIPYPKIEYIKKMTNKVGIFEHSYDTKINYKEGYATDDNARALIVALLHKNYILASTYLGFLESAEKKGYMYCDKKITGEWDGCSSLGDHFGRAIWALCTASLSENSNIKKRAILLLSKLLPMIKKLKYLRPKAFCLMGLSMFVTNDLSKYSSKIISLAKSLALDLISAFEGSSSPGWLWFENILTYDNARLPQALLVYANKVGDSKAGEVGLKTMNFLIDQTYDIEDKCFKFIGSNGWFRQNKLKSIDDEQSLDAAATTEALIEAYQLTEKYYYLELAEKSFAWYHGDNVLKQPLYNPAKASVYDGLGRNLGTIGVSKNQGAESTLSYHLAFFALARVQKINKKMTRDIRVEKKCKSLLSRDFFNEASTDCSCIIIE